MRDVEKHCLTIILPSHLVDLPVKIIRGSSWNEIICKIEEADQIAPLPETIKHKYVFVWCQNEYVKLSLDDILWIEADRSYCKVHSIDGKTRMLSFPLAEIEKRLPVSDFIRVHRSCVVNIKHVNFLIGNSLRMTQCSFTIGREYRKAVLDRFIFLGIRNQKPD